VLWAGRSTGALRDKSVGIIVKEMEKLERWLTHKISTTDAGTLQNAEELHDAASKHPHKDCPAELFRCSPAGLTPNKLFVGDTAGPLTGASWSELTNNQRLLWIELAEAGAKLTTTTAEAGAGASSARRRKRKAAVRCRSRRRSRSLECTPPHLRPCAGV
jgi:hypothetical protein